MDKFTKCEECNNFITITKAGKVINYCVQLQEELIEEITSCSKYTLEYHLSKKLDKNFRWNLRLALVEFYKNHEASENVKNILKLSTILAEQGKTSITLTDPLSKEDELVLKHKYDFTIDKYKDHTDICW